MAAWAAITLLALWVVKDILLFPCMKRHYQPQPAEERIIGKGGNAVTDLAPLGFVRIHGELWQAEPAAGAGSIPEGRKVRVREVRGLTLIVEPDPPARSDRAPHILHTSATDAPRRHRPIEQEVEE